MCCFVDNSKKISFLAPPAFAPISKEDIHKIRLFRFPTLILMPEKKS
jgi:hypothetical protein